MSEHEYLGAGALENSEEERLIKECLYEPGALRHEQLMANKAYREALKKIQEYESNPKPAPKDKRKKVKMIH